MFDHLASVQQMWHTGPGDGLAAWPVVDYSKAYDSVSHPMMAALFWFICIPAPWIRVVLHILWGPVLFLVMGEGCEGTFPDTSVGHTPRGPVVPYIILSSHFCYLFPIATLWGRRLPLL